MVQRRPPGHMDVQNVPTMQHAPAVMVRRLFVIQDIINTIQNVWNVRTIIICAATLCSVARQVIIERKRLKLDNIFAILAQQLLTMIPG